MWGRELRAGLVFVLISVLAGGAVRGWQREHRERFAEIVESLAAYDAAAPTLGRAAAPEDSVPTEPRGGAGTKRSRARPTAEPLRPESIDVDRAGAAELERLPGIGPALAARIVAERTTRGAFGGPEGLLRVSGIGPKTLAKLRPYLAPARESGGQSDTGRAK